MAKIVFGGTENDRRAIFMCPGCGFPHQPRVAGIGPWSFNNDIEKPTFSPSILVKWTEGEEKIEKVCHSFVTDGQIRFLGDCTHSLVNQTVPLPDIDGQWGDS